LVISETSLASALSTKPEEPGENAKKANKVSYRKQTAIERQHACHKQNFLARTWCVVNVVKNILSSSFITMQNLVTISYTLYVNVGGPKNLQYLRI